MTGYRLNVAALLALLGTACGTTPTQPTPPTSPVVVQAAPAPSPAPAPTPPAPTPPAPTPPPSDPPGPGAPTPAPAPPSPVRELFDGVTTYAHWHGTATIPPQFVLEMKDGAIVIGDLSMPITVQSDTAIISSITGVSTFDMHTGGSGWTWTYTSTTGDAAGSLVKR